MRRRTRDGDADAGRLAAGGWAVTGPAPAGAAVLRALLEICGPGFARAAGPADTVAGRQAGFVAVPGTAEATAALLAMATDKGHVAVARGAGTKLDWGAAPPRVDLLVDTGRLAGVWRHAPEELVAEIGPGTPVRAVQATLARFGQRLAIDPPSPGATLGGVLALDESGPLRYRFGTPCEQLLSVRRVDRAGHLVTANLTGRDQPARELCGPPAGPGVLVSATMRLQQLPAARAWVTRPVWSPLEVHDLVRSVLHAGLSPAAVEVDLPGTTELPPSPGSPRRAGAFGVLIEGGPAGVAERSDQLQRLLGADAAVLGAAPAWWGRYPFTADDVAVRITVPISDLHAAVYALSDAAGAVVPVRGSAGVGTVYAALPGDTPPARVTEIVDGVRAVLLARGGRCAVIAAPPAVRGSVDMEGGIDTD